jgi:hypothetical protein
MLKKYFVTGTWIVTANSAEEAQNFVENAVAGNGELYSELDDCNAELDLSECEEEEFEGAPDDEGPLAEDGYTDNTFRR